MRYHVPVVAMVMSQSVGTDHSCLGDHDTAASEIEPLINDPGEKTRI